MSDKRSVQTDALETLGTLNLDDTAGRDAIHLAVEPVIAGEFLKAGEHVCLSDGKAYSSGSKLLGIVDPFLEYGVKQGQKFWLVVYPRQITSLRHVWSHPDFAEDTKELAIPTSGKSEDVIWIEDFANSVGITYSILMNAADTWLETNDSRWGGEYLNLGGLLEGESVPDEFWDHYEKVKGISVENHKRGSFFTCSC